jgi:hypothetical protein
VWYFTSLVEYVISHKESAISWAAEEVTCCWVSREIQLASPALIPGRVVTILSQFVSINGCLP